MVYCICEVPNGKLYDSERNCRQMENHRTASSNSLQNKSYSRSNTSKPDLVDPIECIKTNKTIILWYRHTKRTDSLFWRVVEHLHSFYHASRYLSQSRNQIFDSFPEWFPWFSQSRLTNAISAILNKLLSYEHLSKPDACVNPRRALYRQASQKALKNLPLTSLAHSP